MNARRETRSAPMTYRNALRLDRLEVVDGAPIGADSDLHKAARAKRKPVTVGDVRNQPGLAGRKTKCFLTRVLGFLDKAMQTMEPLGIAWQRNLVQIRATRQAFTEGLSSHFGSGHCIA